MSYDNGNGKQNYGPSLTMARLYRKTSAKGQTYFVGRMGMLKVAMLKSNETSDSGDEIWNIVVSQAAAPPKTRDNQQSNDYAPPRPRVTEDLNDEVPF